MRFRYIPMCCRAIPVCHLKSPLTLYVHSFCKDNLFLKSVKIYSFLLVTKNPNSKGMIKKKNNTLLKK